MRTIRKITATTTICLLALFLGLAPAAADSVPGKLNIKVTGPGGKPVTDPQISESELGVETDKFGNTRRPPGKGRVVTVTANDGEGNMRQSVVYVPDGTPVDMVMPLKPLVLPDFAEAVANDAKKRGDAKTYEKAYDAIKMSRDEMQRVNLEAQDSIDAWAKDNGLRKQSLEEVDKQLATSEKLAAKGLADQAGVDMLKAYKAKLKDLKVLRGYLDSYDKVLERLDASDGKVTLLPSTCPEGQSGGLLAGLLNSATGTTSFTGICDDQEKQNKDRQQGERNEEHRDE